MCHVCWLQYLFSGEIFFIIIRVLRQWHQHQTHWSASADYCKHHQRHITSCWGGIFTDKVLAAEVHLYNEESSWLPAPGEQCHTQYLSRLISLSMMSMINTKIKPVKSCDLGRRTLPTHYLHRQFFVKSKWSDPIIKDCCTSSNDHQFEVCCFLMKI